MTTTITIRGRTYDVAQQSTATKRGVVLQYVLTGKRGAVYGTMRNAHKPSLMFIINGRGFGIPAGLDRVWLSDEGGELKVLAQ